jgi:hypothetical protein
MEDRETKREEGGTAKIALTERDEVRDLKDGIWTQIMDLDAIECKKSMEEFRRGERKSAL